MLANHFMLKQWKQNLWFKILMVPKKCQMSNFYRDYKMGNYYI